jgi:hypothetical protein
MDSQDKRDVDTSLIDREWVFVTPRLFGAEPDLSAMLVVGPISNDPAGAAEGVTEEAESLLAALHAEIDRSPRLRARVQDAPA